MIITSLHLSANINHSFSILYPAHDFTLDHRDLPEKVGDP